MSFWRKTKRLNKAASPSTLTSFKRPLLKAPGSGKHGLLRLCQHREAPGGQRLPGLTRACSCTGEQAAPRPVGKPSRQRLVLLASVRGSGGSAAPLLCFISLSAQHMWCQLAVQTQLSPLGSWPGKLLRDIPDSKCKDLTSGGQPSTSRAETSRPVLPAEGHSSRVLGDAEPQPCTVGIHSITHSFFFCRTVKRSGSLFPDQGSNPHLHCRKSSLNHWTAMEVLHNAFLNCLKPWIISKTWVPAYKPLLHFCFWGRTLVKTKFTS